MTIKVSLLYSTARDACIDIPLVLPTGARVRDALHTAHFYKAYPEAVDYMIGIFSTLVSMDTVLSDGDRIEIYRPLYQDPKLARRMRAKKR